MGSLKGQEKTRSNLRKKHAAAGSKAFPATVKGLIAVGAVGIVGLLLLVVLIHSPWVQERLIRAAAARIQEETGARVGMSGYRWHPFRSLEIEEPSAEADGRRVFSAAALRVDYALSWGRPHLNIRDVIVTLPVLRLEKNARGSWSLPVSVEKDARSTPRSGSRWDGVPPVTITVVSGRIQGFDGDRCVMEVAEMNGRLSLRGRADGGRSGVEISLDSWRMELVEPVRDTVQLTAQVLHVNGMLHLERFAATVNETSHMTASGTWYDLPDGPLAMELRLAPWRFSMKEIGGREPILKDVESLEGTIRLEGTAKDLRCRYDLQSSRGNLTGEAQWIASAETSRLSVQGSLGEVLLPWGAKGPTAVSGTARMTLEWNGSGEPKGNLSAALREFAAGSLTLRDLAVDAVYDSRVLTVRRAAARVRDTGMVEISGTAVFPREKGSKPTAGPVLNFLVELARLPLAAFQDLMPERVMAGSVSGRGTLQGPFPALTWTGRLTATDVALAPFRAKKVTIEGVSSLADLRGARKLTVDMLSFAYGNRSGDSLSVSFRQDSAGDPIPLEAEGRRFLGADRITVKGTVASLFDFPMVLRLDKAEIWAGGENFQIQGEARYGKDILELPAVRVIHGSEQAVVRGTIRRPGPVDLSVQAAGVNMGSWLAKFLGDGRFKPREPDKVSPALRGTGQAKEKPQTAPRSTQEFFSVHRLGRVNGQLRLQGSWDNPMAVFDGAASELDMPGLGRSVLAFLGRYEKGMLSGRGELSGASLESPLIVEGAWPVQAQLFPLKISGGDGGEGRLRLSARDVSLERFQALIPLENVTGRASWDVRLTGPLGSLRLDGAGAVTQAAFRWPGWGERLENMEVHWRAEGQSILIEEAVFTLLGGRARAHGEIRLAQGRFDGYTVHVAGENVQFPEIFGIEGEGAARGTIVQQGGAFAPDISGEVVLSKASINLGELEKDVARQIRVVEETGDGPVVRIGRRRAPSEKTEGFQNAAMKLEIRLPPKGARARGFGLDAEVQGSAVLQKARGGPVQLLGTLSTSTGEYAFQGVRFKIVEGEVTFRGHTPPDPFLSLTCRKEVRDVSVTASLSGQLSRPALVFSSFPEMDQVDIVSVLLYGRPARDLSASQSRDLQDRGLQFVWGGTTPVVKSLLGKTPLSPDAVDIKGTENGSVVEIGKYLTPELYVTYQKGLEGDDKDELRAEYRVNRYLSVESQVGREDRAGVDVFFRYDFGN